MRLAVPVLKFVAAQNPLDIPWTPEDMGAKCTEIQRNMDSLHQIVEERDQEFTDSIIPTDVMNDLGLGPVQLTPETYSAYQNASVK